MTVIYLWQFFQGQRLTRVSGVHAPSPGWSNGWIALLSFARILITIQRIKVLGKNQLRSIQWIEIHPLDRLWIELSTWAGLFTQS